MTISRNLFVKRRCTRNLHTVLANVLVWCVFPLALVGFGYLLAVVTGGKP